MPNCFGKGLVIRHLQNIVVSAAVKAGNDCTLLHNVTIGVAMHGHKGVPAIGDNVLICVGAAIVGGVHVGNNIIIGANAVVTHDIKDNSTVAGVPAKMIK